MSQFNMGDQIKFANGDKYLFVTSFQMDGQEYVVLGRDSDDKNDEAFIIGKESVGDNGKVAINAIQDVQLLAKIHKYLQDNPEILGQKKAARERAGGFLMVYFADLNKIWWGRIEQALTIYGESIHSEIQNI